MGRARRLSLEELAPYLLELPADAPQRTDQPEAPAPGGPSLALRASLPLDWAAVFGNDRPVEVEVGFGKGLFLLSAAQECPHVNFLGIEILRKYQLFTATRLAKRGLRNVRLAKADAREFFRDRIAPAALQAVHVYFPDPWWKKRHHKRRVFTADFAGQCARSFRPGGRLHVVTDVDEYYQLIVELLAEQPALRPLPPPDPHQPAHDLDYLTNFERKFRKEGRPIFRAAYERIG